MHDILFRIPLPFFHRTLPVYSYGVMAMLGFLVGIVVARRRARKIGFSPDDITDIALWALVGGIAGSRLFYVVQNSEYFFDTSRPDWSLLDLFKIWQGGLVFYGGFIGACIAVAAATRYKRARLLAVFDLLAPSLAIGHAFGRIGCFLHGCCYGVAVKRGAWYGVVFPDGAPAYDPRALNPIPPGTPVFPTQLVSSFDLFIIFVILSLFFRRRRGEGQVAALYLMLYSAHRFVIEFFRGDTHLPGMLSVAQWMSMGVFFAGAVLFLYAGERGMPAGAVGRAGAGTEGMSGE